MRIWANLLVGALLVALGVIEGSVAALSFLDPGEAMPGAYYTSLLISLLMLSVLPIAGGALLFWAGLTMRRARIALPSQP